jgi:hypothetical protein
MKKIILSKSLFLEGIRCPRLIWFRFNRPHLAEPLDETTEHLFSVGHRLEGYARELFGGGILIGGGRTGPFSSFLAETEAAMNSGNKYLHEAAFENNKMRCRTDILHKWDHERWNLAELKMCSKLKDQHIDDVAFQRICVENSGHKIDRTFLMHVNPSYVRGDKIDPEKLLVAEDISSEVLARMPKVKETVETMIALVQQPEQPETLVGTKCSSPGRCSFFQHCHGCIAQGSIHELPYGARVIPVLLSQGIHRLVDIPSGFPLSTRQAALVASARQGSPIVNTGAIKSFVNTIAYPRHFIDFETVAPCIPVFTGSSPFEKVPFQFSLHVQKNPDSGLEHYEFLPENRDDPRLSLLQFLMEKLDEKGSLIAWYQPFEISVFKNLAQHYPDYAGKINLAINRFSDLIVPFKGAAYTDYRFGGSASIKKVLPILCPSLTYDNLAIQHGDDASLLYERYIEGSLSEADWIQAREKLRKYCERDTWGMVKILEFLEGLC